MIAKPTTKAGATVSSPSLANDPVDGVPDASIATILGKLGAFFALTKPRVMSLVVFTAVVGLLLAPSRLDPVVKLIAILSIALGAGAAGALNMWYDAEVDALMSRTAARRIPRGRVSPREALAFGLTAAAVSVIALALATNLAAAGLLAFTIFFYVAVKCEQRPPIVCLRSLSATWFFCSLRY